MENSATSPQSTTLVPTRSDLQDSGYSSGTSDPNKTTSDTYAPQTSGAVLSNSNLFNSTATTPLTVTNSANQNITVPTKQAAVVVTHKKTINWPLFAASFLLIAVAIYILMRTGSKQHKKELLKR